ncbi:MAG: Tfp pilus assembly protein FimT/FimU [Clostridia bacterium]
MKTKVKNVKGITLIALVITIIVLLILAGVTSATLTGDNGILTKANEAKTITNEKDEEEQIEIGYTEYLMADQTGEKVNFEVSEAAVTGKEGDWIIRFNKTGKEYYFDGETITKVTWKQEEDTITNIETKQTLKVGDYVDYDPTLEANASDLTYTSKTDKTGADSDQEFNAETYKNAEYGWRILGVSKGKLRLISGEFVGAGNYTNGSRTYYTLKGQKGYINGIEELNKII